MNMFGQACNSARPSSSGAAYQAIVPPGPPPLAPPSQGEKERTDIGDKQRIKRMATGWNASCDSSICPDSVLCSRGCSSIPHH